MKAPLIMLLLVGFNMAMRSQVISGHVEAETRYFTEEGKYPGQYHYYPSLGMELDFTNDLQGIGNEFQAVIFGRFDFRDKKRTHIDLREFFYLHRFANGYTSIGFKKIFWGVAESSNINDIINQKDFLEGVGSEAKLGEFMWQNVIVRSFGTFETYFMPYHRPAHFPGENGRLRPPFLNSDKNRNLYTNELQQLYPSIALRYKHVIKNFDIGINYSHMLSREPEVEFGTDAYEIYYPVINQFGADIQYTVPGLLLKLELNNRIYEGSKLALVSGFEYTLGNVFNQGGDLGFVAEYLYDARGTSATTSMDNDLFVGFRYSGNNIAGTQILAGGIIDLSKSSRIFSFEVSHRLGSLLKLQMEGKWFVNISDQEFVHLFEKDSYIQLKLLLYFL